MSVLLWWVIVTLLLPPVLPVNTSIAIDGSYAYSYRDPITGATAGSGNRGIYTSTMESMIKPWIAADYLRRTAEPSTERLRQITAMLHDSDDAAAQQVYQGGGGAAVVTRMVDICRLRSTTAHPGWWSLTRGTADDAVRLGTCLADGRAAGRWTTWLLEQMRGVRTMDRFGIIDALPVAVAAGTSIKNGWTRHGDTWHLNCLAVHPRFVLAVLTRYPAHRGIAYGAQVCRRITATLAPVSWP